MSAADVKMEIPIIVTDIIFIDICDYSTITEIKHVELNHVFFR